MDSRGDFPKLAKRGDCALEAIFLYFQSVSKFVPLGKLMVWLKWDIFQDNSNNYENFHALNPKIS